MDWSLESEIALFSHVHKSADPIDYLELILKVQLSGTLGTDCDS